VKHKTCEFGEVTCIGLPVS